MSDSRSKPTLKDEFYPAPYHERSSSLPSDSSLFVPSRRSMSPPLLMRYSPPSSPLVSRNLFPSSASINSSLYSQNNDDDEDGGRLFSSIPPEEEQLAKLRSEYSEACLELDKLPKFSKEWFDLKTKTVNLEEQMENHESGSVGGSSHLSYGGVADRSSAAWSEEDDEIMSFASDLELCMIGEALKQGNCILSPFDNEDYISPIGDDEYCDEGVLLALDDCEFPHFVAAESNSEKENMSAVLIQSQWRQRHRSKAYRFKVSSAIKLQAFVRCKMQQSKYKKQRRQLIIVQNSIRKHSATSKYLLTLLSVKRIQRVWKRKANLKSASSIQSPVQRWAAQRTNAVLIQNSWRQHSQTKRFLMVRKAIICIQSCVRMKQQQKNFRILANVILIQSVARGRLVRSRIHQDNVAASHSILQDQDSVHSKSIVGESSFQNSPKSHSKSSARPSVENILSHHRALSMRRSQVPKFSDEWFYTTELLQGLEHELRIRERELHDVSDELLSHEDSRHDDDLSGSIPSMREASSPTGQVRIAQSIEAQSSSRQSSPSATASGWTNFSSNDFATASSTSSNSAEEENFKRLGKECLRLTRELDELPRFSDEWFQCKVELKSVTEELEFLYAHSKR